MTLLAPHSKCFSPYSCGFFGFLPPSMDMLVGALDRIGGLSV